MIVFDCQVLQTSAWSRGMGRYLLSLLMGIHQNTDYPKIVLIFNKNLEFDSSKKELIETIIPTAELVYLDLRPGLSKRVERENTKIFDTYLEANQMTNAMFVMASVFSFDFQPAFPSLTINTCIFYDVIPLKHWEMFYNYFPESEYFSRFKFLYESDGIFCISETVRNDLRDMLGFDEADLVTIDGAEIPNLSSEKVKRHNPERSKSDTRTILLPGGNSPHKNMLRAIRGFDLFNAQFGDSYKLVITSFYSSENIARMKALSSNIVLTGEIDDTELHQLYESADLILFPSLDEGLGLPILEAVGYGKPVACSDISIFKEISSDAFSFFDPYNVDNIAEAIVDALGVDAKERQRRYLKIKRKYTWKRSARLLLDASSNIKKYTPSKSSQRDVSIVVEQDGNMEILEKVAPFVRKYYRDSKMKVYMDLLFEYKRPVSTLPFIFHHFLPTKDVVDSIKRKQNEQYIFIYSTRAHYSLMGSKQNLLQEVYTSDSTKNFTRIDS